MKTQLWTTLCGVSKRDPTNNLTAEELARATGLSVTLARERLLLSERRGLTCRDDTAEGLRFYINRFLGSSQ